VQLANVFQAALQPERIIVDLGHHSVLTIDLDAISNNVAIIKSYLQPETTLMAVIKADAYGHGAVQVAKRIQREVHGFAVNDVREGEELRKNEIEKPILIFEPPVAEVANLYKKYDLTATVSDLQHFQILQPGSSYHINFNTGMGRLGFKPERASQVARRVKDRTELHCGGIYSHFATADEPGSSKTSKQYRLFQEVTAHFEPHLDNHLCNTAGIAEYPEAHLDMVRSGIGLYGYAPGKVAIPGLKPALTWKTHLVQVQKIKQGETVSYGAAWKAPEDGFIGTIPVGYSDGIPRRLSGRFKIMIEGESYPVVGRVTMNYCMIFLGNEAIQTGSDAFLLNQHFTAKNWANITDTISYEILTNISSRVPREYNTSEGLLNDN
jgi:alanine racemase